MELPEKVIALLGQTSVCYIATTMPDGSPQPTQTWVDTDGHHVVINSVQGNQKLRNIARDPRVALTIFDPENPSQYFGIRGRVAKTTTEHAVEHIETLAQRYLGTPYPWFGGRDQVRVMITVEAEHLNAMG